MDSSGLRVEYWLTAVWDAACDAFSVAISAITGSGTLVHALDAYNTMRRCSLYFDQATAILYIVESSRCFQDLKALEMSLSSPAEQASASEIRRYKQETTRFLRSLPPLESLHFHWYKTCRTEDQRPDQCRNFFDCVANSVSFPSLLHCWLQGLHSSEAALIHFLTNTPTLESLELEYLTLTPGTWQPVLATC